jgi:Carboxypeptidase regulatory-like domain
MRTSFAALMGLVTIIVTGELVASSREESSSVRTGFYCGNHSPSHYAANAREVQRYSQQEHCSGWSVVARGVVSGAVVDSSGSAVAGLNVQIYTADSVVLGTAVTRSNGRFSIPAAPIGGEYEIRVGSPDTTFATDTANVTNEVKIVVPTDSATKQG